ncbi:MAG: hypothetical protein D3916_00960 [Candidatus Electrothrix sp. MAN1_4]|nr:hypothetical protein [Candidatus Electrothrix sp. MAN1_4]
MITHQTQMFKGHLRKLNRLAQKAKALLAQEQQAEECPFSPVEGEDMGLDPYQDTLDNSSLPQLLEEFFPSNRLPRIHDPPTTHAPLTAEV